MNLSKLISRADKVFRDYLLDLWGAPDRIDCTYCKHSFQPEQIEVGHIISRRFYIIRWHLINVIPLCSKCNQEQDGNTDYFLVVHLSPEQSKKLLALRNDTSFRLTENFILEAIKPYEED